MTQDLRDAWRCVLEAQGALRSMVNQHRPSNARNVNAVKRWLERALADLDNKEDRDA